MTITRRRRGLAGLLVATTLIGASLIAPSASSAQEEPPPPPPVFDGGYSETPLPGYEEYAGCPLLNAGQFRFCIAITVNGDLQLGKVGGDIDNLKMVMAASGGFSGDPVLVPAQGGGGPADVPVSGGILGIPELDPLLALDLLNLLSLSATPQLGELQQTGLDAIITFGVLGFLGYPDFEPILPGDPPAPLPAPGEPFCVNFEGAPQCVGTMPGLTLDLPLNLKLNNLLLGDDCNIGPVDLALTNGTTEPPAGVEPLTGSSGSLALNRFGNGADFHVDGIEFVGNAFEVPGADCAGIAGAGDLLDSIGAGNPFNTLINQQAGLPSPAGQNTARLSVDLHVADQQLVYGYAMDAAPTALDFGDVPFGTTSAPQTVTVTNRRTSARTLNAQPIGFSGGLNTVDNGCSNVVLEAGASCQVTVSYTPTSATHVLNATIRLSAFPDTTSQEVDITGKAV